MDNTEIHQSVLNNAAKQQEGGEPLAEQTVENPLEPSIITSLGSLSISHETELRGHQKDAFTEVVEFFREGGREGYVLHPTGTGKTVLFVEICKQLIEKGKESNEPTRAIILVPKLDLVAQTIGSVDPITGKKRGFKGFAPDIDARDVHGHLSDHTRAINIQQGEVLVTTYNSFRNLVQNFINFDNGPTVDWDKEKQHYERLEATARLERDRLVAERREYTVNYFRANETKRASSFIRSYALDKDDKKPGWLTEDHLARLTTIVESDLDDKQKIGTLKKQLKRIVPRELWNALPRKKETPIDQNEEKEDSEEAAISPFESFAVRFIKRHDRHIPLSRHVFNNSRYVQYWDNLTEEIINQRNTRTYAAGKVRVADNNKKIQEAISQFDLIICDEAHRSIGTMTWEAIRSYAQSKDIAILGLTATDEYFDRSLESYYEKKIHEITLSEAIELGINNPVAMFVDETGLRFSGIELDSYGDYDQLSMREIRNHHGRNMIGINYAKVLTEHGYGGIVSTIPGEEGKHAKVIAELLNSQTIIDPDTGLERELTAAYVLGTIHPEARDQIYRNFEQGKIDWIVYVDVLSEGWDSDRAKALINLRPTRSPLLAKQRQGRIGRVSNDGRVSIVIDLFDGYRSGLEGAEIPPVLGIDVFELDEAEQGQIVGPVDPETVPVINELRRLLSKPIKAHFSQYIENLEAAYKLSASGYLRESAGQAGKQWFSLRSLQQYYKGYLPEEFLTTASQGEEPALRTAYGQFAKNKLGLLFNITDLNALISQMPEVNPTKIYVDENEERWITPEGCKKLLAKVAPHIGAEEILDAISEVEDSDRYQFAKDFGRIKLSFAENAKLYGVTHLYKLSEIIDHLVPVLRSQSKSSFRTE